MISWNEPNAGKIIADLTVSYLSSEMMIYARESGIILKQEMGDQDHSMEARMNLISHSSTPNFSATAASSSFGCFRIYEIMIIAL
jgi:hypothetical protein